MRNPGRAGAPEKSPALAPTADPHPGSAAPMRRKTTRQQPAAWTDPYPYPAAGTKRTTAEERCTPHTISGSVERSRPDRPERQLTGLKRRVRTKLTAPAEPDTAGKKSAASDTPSTAPAGHTAAGTAPGKRTPATGCFEKRNSEHSETARRNPAHNRQRTRSAKKTGTTEHPDPAAGTAPAKTGKMMTADRTAGPPEKVPGSGSAADRTAVKPG